MGETKKYTYLVLFVCSAATLVTTTVSSVENSVFNQMLYNELLDLEWSDYESNSEARHTDHTPVEKCGNKYVKSCCDEVFFQVLIDRLKPLRKICYQETSHKKDRSTFSHIINPLHCDSVNKYRNDIVCTVECMARKKGLLYGNNSIRWGEMTDMLNSAFSKLEWLKPKIDDIIAHCSKKRKFGGSNQHHPTVTHGEKRCNTDILDFVQCMWCEIQFACPWKRILDHKKCNKIKDEVDTCRAV